MIRYDWIYSSFNSSNIYHTLKEFSQIRPLSNSFSLYLIDCLRECRFQNDNGDNHPPTDRSFPFIHALTNLSKFDLTIYDTENQPVIRFSCGLNSICDILYRRINYSYRSGYGIEGFTNNNFFSYYSDNTLVNKQFKLINGFVEVYNYDEVYNQMFSDVVSELQNLNSLIAFQNEDPDNIIEVRGNTSICNLLAKMCKNTYSPVSGGSKTRQNITSWNLQDLINLIAVNLKQSASPQSSITDVISSLNTNIHNDITELNTITNNKDNVLIVDGQQDFVIRKQNNDDYDS